jgi:DNA (cytosine-5)-methyltransferase 1
MHNDSNTDKTQLAYSTCYALPLLTHGSLFSGIGGFEEGAERAGIKTLWNCEFEAFQRSILSKHYKDNEQYTDVRTANISAKVDIISGGFPC